MQSHLQVYFIHQLRNINFFEKKTFFSYTI